MMVAQTTRAAKGSPTQTMISGAMATIGVTCKATAQGWIAARSSGLAATRSARATPSAVAAISAARVTVSVAASAAISPAGSPRKAAAIASGPGTR